MENRTEQTAKKNAELAAENGWNDAAMTEQDIATMAKRLERIAMEIKDRAETVLFFLKQDSTAGLKNGAFAELSYDYDHTTKNLRELIERRNVHRIAK
jgi:hypothetical protein